MTNFWREAACDDSNRVSSSRIISLVAGLTLSIATLVLTFGSFWYPVMLSTLSVFGPFLATLAGTNYVANKMNGKKTDA
jgi:hypothetical protein